MVGDTGSTMSKKAKIQKKYTDLSASTDMLINGRQMYHAQGGESLNDIFSGTRNSLCLRLRSDLLRRCLKDQIKDVQSETFLLEPEHNEAKTLHLERNQGVVMLKRWLGGPNQEKRCGSCFEDGCPYMTSTDCFICPWDFHKPKGTDDLLTYFFFLLIHTTGVCTSLMAGDILRGILEVQIYPFWVDFFSMFFNGKRKSHATNLGRNGIGVSKLYQG